MNRPRHRKRTGEPDSAADHWRNMYIYFSGEWERMVDDDNEDFWTMKNSQYDMRLATKDWDK